MSLRTAVLIALAVGACALAWQQRDRLRGMASATAGLADTSTGATGGLRKCVKGAEVSYTNVACPAGFREQVVSGSVNVVPATPVPKATAADQASSGPAALREMLDMRRGETLHDKAVERAIDPGR